MHVADYDERVPTGTEDEAWRPVEECPEDFDRPGGRRTWRLRLVPLVEPGRSYGLDDVPEPVETTGRRNLFTDTGWIETGSNRELRPTHYAPLAG